MVGMALRDSSTVLMHYNRTDCACAPFFLTSFAQLSSGCTSPFPFPHALPSRHTAIFVAVAYLALSFLLFVPDWSFSLPDPSLASAAPASFVPPPALHHLPHASLSPSEGADASPLARALLAVAAANSTVAVSAACRRGDGTRTLR